MITFEDVQEYRGIKVGDMVSKCPDSGFQSGVRSVHTVKEIRLCHYDAESRRKCNEIVSTHVVYTFTDGELAGNYDRVTKTTQEHEHERARRIQHARMPRHQH